MPNYDEKCDLLFSSQSLEKKKKSNLFSIILNASKIIAKTENFSTNFFSSYLKSINSEKTDENVETLEIICSKI